MNSISMVTGLGRHEAVGNREGSQAFFTEARQSLVNEHILGEYVK